MDFDSAYKRASALCTRQEYCCSDIKEKLFQWDVEKETAKEVIYSLIKDKFIDENRYAGSYTRDKFKFNGWGKQKIIWNLRQKKIPEDIIQNSMETIDSDEYEKKLLNTLQEKSKKIKENDHAKKKAALIRFAASKGFEMKEIMLLVKKIK